MRTDRYSPPIVHGRHNVHHRLPLGANRTGRANGFSAGKVPCNRAIGGMLMFYSSRPVFVNYVWGSTGRHGIVLRISNRTDPFSLHLVRVLEIMNVLMDPGGTATSRAYIQRARNSTGESPMSKVFAGVVAALALVSASDAEAGWFCGAASYRCCPVSACQPSCCYTACKVERQTCYRTVYDNVCEPQEFTYNKTIYETVCEDRQLTCYRTVNETHFREQNYTVCRPVYETSCREERYQVSRPVWETSYYERNYTVCRPVYEESVRECRRVVCRPVCETVERECRRTVMHRVVETVNHERCYTVMKPVTTYRAVRQDCGHWETRTCYHPGPVVPRVVCDPCCGPRVCMTQCPGFTTCHKVWCPQIVERQVACTSYCPQVVREQCPVQVCRMVPECVVERVPVQVTRLVREEVVDRIPVRTCRLVHETRTCRVPVRTCRMVCEEKVRQIPVTTCRMVHETRTCRVPYCVSTQVPYTVTHRVAHCVPRNVTETCTRMVSRCVPRQVAYEVCRVVPVTVCPDSSCSTCADGSCGTAPMEAYPATPPTESAPEPGQSPPSQPNPTDEAPKA